MRILIVYAILFIGLLHTDASAIWQVDKLVNITARIAATKDIIKENYNALEIKRDKPFSYISSPRIFLMSEPSSGNTWCRYGLEFLTKRPSTEYFIDYRYDTRNYHSLPKKSRTWFNAINPPFGVQYPDMDIDFSKTPIIKHHYPKKIYRMAGIHPLIYPSQDKLILIVRDFKELYFRHQQLHFPGNSKIYNKSIFDSFPNYFVLLKFFDSFPKDRKILIYYEDLISEPKKTFSKLLDFLGDDKEYLDDFLNKINFHKQRCFSLYNTPKHCRSFGKKGFTYTEGVSSQDLLFMENEIKNKLPDLFAKYLKRYKLTN